MSNNENLVFALLNGVHKSNEIARNMEHGELGVVVGGCTGGVPIAAEVGGDSTVAVGS